MQIHDPFGGVEHVCSDRRRHILGTSMNMSDVSRRLTVGRKVRHLRVGEILNRASRSCNTEYSCHPDVSQASVIIRHSAMVDAAIAPAMADCARSNQAVDRRLVVGSGLSL